MQNKHLLNLWLFFKKHKRLVFPIVILLILRPLFNVVDIIYLETSHEFIANIIGIGLLVILCASLIFLIYLSTQYKKGWLLYLLLVILSPVYFFWSILGDSFIVFFLVYVPFYFIFSFILWIIIKKVKQIIIKRNSK